MDGSFPQRGADTQQRRGFSAGLQILDRFESWLARLVEWTKLTEEEQRDAGVHLRQFTKEEQMDAGIHPGDERDK